VDESNPNDIAFVYSGYAPLSVRVIQTALKNQWKQKEDVLRLLPGPSAEETQVGNIVSDKARNPVTLVFFLGGVTFTEISALRWLSDQETYGDIIIATTKLINGNSFLFPMLTSIPRPEFK